MAKDKELKPEHKIFAENYVIAWNGTKSYQVAYPDSSYESAMSSACDLLRNPKILDYIEEIQKDLAKLAGLSALSNLNELKAILDKEGEQTKDRIKAIEVINKMLGNDAPIKNEIKVENKTISPEDRESEIKRLIDKANGNN